ncbi:MAG: hypothetical protein AAFV85_23070 [Cyanobacteria bacterium J06634_6]
MPSSTVSLEFISPDDGSLVGNAQVSINRFGQICLQTVKDIPAGSVAIIPSLLMASIPQVQASPPPSPTAPPKFSSFDHH